MAACLSRPDSSGGTVIPSDHRVIVLPGCHHVRVRHARVALLWLTVLAALCAGLTACSATATTPQVTVTATTKVTVTSTPRPDAAATPSGTARSVSGLPTMPADDLPPEAESVLEAVATDGPYDYPQDGQTFQNRERILPAQPLGFYREFTVETPGSSDRGARRLVVGSDGVAFYTSDHYQSFREVIP